MSHISKLIKAKTRKVTLPHSGWNFKLVRANAYDFLGASIPLGSLLQKLSRATADLARVQEIPDDLAAELNRDAPSHTKMCEMLLIHSVNAMKLSDAQWEEEWQELWQEDHPGEQLPAEMPEQPWKRVQVVEDDTAQADMSPDAIRVDDFVRAMDTEDLGTLQRAIWELNGLGEVVGKALAPFRPEGRPDAPPDGQGVQETPHGASGDGPDGIPAQRGNPPGGDGTAPEAD
jgi:hypothetical protein